jgi:hypothetical protein
MRNAPAVLDKRVFQKMVTTDATAVKPRLAATRIHGGPVIQSKQ